METETITTRTATLSSSPVAVEGSPEFLILRDGRAMVLTRGDLQAIVQQAYDQAGMLAEPSYAAEAHHDPGPACEWYAKMARTVGVA